MSHHHHYALYALQGQQVGGAFGPDSRDPTPASFNVMNKLHHHHGGSSSTGPSTSAINKSFEFASNSSVSGQLRSKLSWQKPLQSLKVKQLTHRTGANSAGTSHANGSSVFQQAERNYLDTKQPSAISGAPQQSGNNGATSTTRYLVNQVNQSTRASASSVEAPKIMVSQNGGKGGHSQAVAPNQPTSRVAAIGDKLRPLLEGTGHAVKSGLGSKGATTTHAAKRSFQESQANRMNSYHSQQHSGLNTSQRMHTLGHGPSHAPTQRVSSNPSKPGQTLQSQSHERVPPPLVAPQSQSQVVNPAQSIKIQKRKAFEQGLGSRFAESNSNRRELHGRTTLGEEGALGRKAMNVSSNSGAQSCSMPSAR